MAKTILLPDIHTRWRHAAAILAHEETYDKAIFLGDVFDAYHDTAEDNRFAALWYKESLKDPRHVHLMSNHDLPYRFPYNSLLADYPGSTKEKVLRINEVMTEEDWLKVKYWHVEHGILFSHAGVSTRFLNQVNAFKSLEGVLIYLELELPYALKNLEALISRSALFELGYSRNGRVPLGGPLWADFDDEAMPTEFPQIVGHTPHDDPSFLFREPNGSRLIRASTEGDIPDDYFTRYWWQLDLDTHLNHYAILEGNQLTIKKVYWEGKDLLDTAVVFSKKVLPDDTIYT